VPPEWFAFIEESTYDKAGFRMTFSNVPTTGKISRMLVNKGTMTLRDLGGTLSPLKIDGSLCARPACVGYAAIASKRIR